MACAFAATPARPTQAPNANSSDARAATLGSEASSYPQCSSPASFASFVAPIEQTAKLCGLEWEAPFIVFDADRIDDATLAEHAARFRARVEQFAAAPAERDRAAAVRTEIAS